ncbi:hypothetical protein GCM10007199_20350 [Fictibacillus barbaricus]|nr:hypothetical protein GCM10007199_20350 [Fictibacillus barbaricus]
MANKVKNRWLIAAAAVGIHISIGSVYSWSVFTNPLREKHDWGLSEISLTFSIAILFLGLSAAFMGHFVERFGPRTSGFIASICFGVDYWEQVLLIVSVQCICFTFSMELWEESDLASAILLPFLH